MELDIRPLSPALIDDWLDFFDRVAFADHHEWSACYCIHFHWNDDMECEGQRLVAQGEAWSGRPFAIRKILDGSMRGFLAYMDGVVVGWCCADDRRNFHGLVTRSELWKPLDPPKIYSVVCFNVAPSMRGQGIATALLDAACEHADREGFDAVEAYPARAQGDQYLHHHGPPSLYAKREFAPVMTLSDAIVVRRSCRR